MLAVLSACISAVSAQSMEERFKSYRQDVMAKFNASREDMETRFSTFRDSVNSRFADFLKNAWESADMNKAIPQPVKPEPKPVIDTTKALSSNPLPFLPPAPVAPKPVDPEAENQTPMVPKPVEPKPVEPQPVVPQPVVPEPVVPEPVAPKPVQPEPVKPAPVAPKPVQPKPVIPEPVAPQPKQPQPDESYFAFQYYGETCKVHLPKTAGYSIDAATNDAASAAWEILTSGPYDSYILDCLQYRKKLSLCDWGLYQFILHTSRSYFGDESRNDAVLFRVYALSQLGYKVRLGIRDGKFINLVAIDEAVFGKSYLTIDGRKFYLLESKPGSYSLKLCNFAFPQERAASLDAGSLPVLPKNQTAKKHVQSKAYPSVAVDVSVNRNLMAFMDTYPGCSWELFAQASLSPEVKAQMYPPLRKAVAGRSEAEAANILINLIQTGFQYKTDGDQFGREKTFFGDEAFFYPYCDCEDRSVLYAILVKDLLGLDVVLLEYPTHIATAVCFKEDVRGDYFNIDGKKYVICDPTYIGASIGKSMPDMRKLNAKIHKVR